MAVFPTLTENGVNIIPSYPLVEQLEDTVIRSSMEAGYVQTRARNPRVRRTWQISYQSISNTNKVAITDFVTTVNGGADSFTWTNPVDSVSYSVRFKPIPVCSNNVMTRWDVKFGLEQV